MTDQVQTPEAGEQSQDTTTEVENLGAEETQVESGEQEQEQQQEPKESKVVPLGALHEERNRRKELQQKMQTMEERFGQLAQIVQQRLTPQQQREQAPEIPDVNTDPVGHFRAKTEALERQIAEMQRPIQEVQQSRQQQAMTQRATHAVASQIREFAAEKPDVVNAIQFIQEADRKALEAIGHDPAEAQMMVESHHDQLVMSLLQKGMSVPLALYQLATTRGYQAKASQQNAQEKLEGLKKGVGAARSLGSGGGVSAKLSLAALADMPADEFAKTVGSDDDFRKLFGG